MIFDLSEFLLRIEVKGGFESKLLEKRVIDDLVDL
jgi:hypothetical protein